MWIIFTSKCVSCALNSHLLTYSLIEDNLEKTSNLPVGLIFSPYFYRKDIVTKVKELDIQSPIYLSIDELYKIEDVYYKTPYTPYDVVVIKTDSNNSIVYLESFSTFINQIKKGLFNEKRLFF